MLNYLKNVLHMNINMEEAENIYKQLPLLYKGTYDIFMLNSGGAEWLVMRPKAA